jgi:site-specific recombinase XerC
MHEVDRQVLLGHAPATMTQRYTHAELERIRGVLDQLAARIEPAKTGSNVVEIRRIG